MKRVLAAALFVLILVQARPAVAGDSATIVLKSGIVLYMANGFTQLLAGMKNLKQTGSENYPIEVNIEGTSFFINLGDVAVLCRDTCGSLKIEHPKKQNKD